MRRLLALLVLAVVAPAASAATKDTVACTAIVDDRPTVRHEVALGGGLTAYVDDRYGGYVSRQTHGAFAFTLRVRRGTHVLDREERVAAVDVTGETIDGRATRNPFYANSRLMIGRHVFAFSLTRAGETKPFTLRVGFTVGACGPAQAYGALTSRHGGLALDAWSGRNERGGNPTLDGVALVGSRDVRVHIPPATRGRIAGRLLLRGATFDARPKPLTLRVPRTGTTLLRRGALRVILDPPQQGGFLVVNGLPAHTTGVALQLTGGTGRALVSGPRLSPLTIVLGGEAAGVTTFPVRPLCASCSVGL